MQVAFEKAEQQDVEWGNSESALLQLKSTGSPHPWTRGKRNKPQDTADSSMKPPEKKLILEKKQEKPEEKEPKSKVWPFMFIKRVVTSYNK